MEDERHYPPGAGPETPATPEPETPKAPEGEQPVTPAEQPKPGEEQPPEAKKPEEGKPTEPEPQPIKKRSIYDDLKDERGKRKDADARVKELEEENARLKGGQPPAEPEKPAAPSNDKPTDELEAYAQENGLDAQQLGRLAEIIAKRTPAAQLSDEDRQALADLKTWRAEQARSTEDNEILATAPSIKQQLGISDDAELQNVMKEIVRLAHTPEFHDKEVDYIVWKSRDALAKLVSPKKPSFEHGGQPGEAAPEAEPDFSNGKVTPETAGKSVRAPRASYDIEHPKN